MTELLSRGLQDILMHFATWKGAASDGGRPSTRAYTVRASVSSTWDFLFRVGPLLRNDQKRSERVLNLGS
jgi:hypothetical protein